MRFIDLQEGPNDPGIFKAVFFAGGPGSGKSYVANQLGLISRGLKVLNSDDALEFLMRKHDLSFDMPPEEQPQRDVARQRAKELTKKKQDIYLGGRLGLIIDGTAKDVDKMAKLKTELEAIGYQTMMVFVNTSLKTALQRNLLRDRKVPTDIVLKSHKQVQQNKDNLANVFAPNFVEIINDDNPDFNTPLKRIDKFLDAPITSQARDWVSKASVQKSITQEDAQGKPKVYVDMDGVIANFYAGVTRVTGHEEPRAMALQDIEDTMASFKGTDFFFQLPKYDQADELIALVNKMTGGDWYILSSPLKYDREGSAKHKAAWVKKFLKIQPNGMHFTGDKAQFATQPDGTPNILIDDYPKYLEKWTNAGGIGVKYKGHVGNIEDVKATLDQHLGNTKPVEEAKESIKDQIEKAVIVDGGSIDEYYVRSASVDKLGYSAKQTFGRSPDVDDPNFSVDYIGHSKGKPALWFYPLSYYLKSIADEAYGKGMPHVWLVRIKPNAWLQPVSSDKAVKQEAPKGKERVGILRKSTVPAAIFFKPAFDVVDKFYDYGSQHKRHGEVKGVPETIRKVKGGYRLVSKSGKNLGTYPSKAGAEKRERQVQYFKHMGEQGRSTAVEPHEPGYQHSLLTAPQNTLVVDKSDDMDFYKLGQHYTSLSHYDPHELGVGPSDMTITFASPEEMERMKKVFDKLGVKYKDISGSHEEPEIHSKESRVNEIADNPYDYIQNVKTPEKRVYRFQTDAGQLYRVQVLNRHTPDIKNFGIEKNLEIHFDLTDKKTGKPNTGVTGTGDAVRVFSTVASILQKEVAEQNPPSIVIASKADDESRVKLYRTLARRATKLMPDYEVTGEKQVTGADGNPYLTIKLELKK